MMENCSFSRRYNFAASDSRFRSFNHGFIFSYRGNPGFFRGILIFCLTFSHLTVTFPVFGVEIRFLPWNLTFCHGNGTHTRGISSFIVEIEV